MTTMGTSPASSRPVRDGATGQSRLLHVPPDEVIAPLHMDLPVALSTYDDAIAFPLTTRPGKPRIFGAVYERDGRLVPDSERPKRNRSWRTNPSRLRGPGSSSPVRVPGRTFYAGHFRPGFGHVLVETLPRFWPDLDYDTFDQFALYPTRAGLTRTAPNLPRYAVDLLHALGVRPDRSLLVSTQALQFEELVVATPAFWLRRGSNPVCAEPFRRIGDALDDRPDHDRLPTDSRRIYLSRARLRPPQRRALNEAGIEDLMRLAGFAVIHPQEHPVQTQIRMIRRADAIAGCDGSALHLGAFARPGTTLLAIDSRTVLNQLIIDDLSGLDAVHVYAVDHAIVGRTGEWEADLDRVREAMAAAGLD